MALDIAVTAHNLGKRYKIYPDSRARMIEWLSGRRLTRHTEKWALRGVSFEVPKGSALGVVGANGAGKSTLLKILTGTTVPSTGHYEIAGRVGSLLELGAGFHPEFSGRDNIFMNAAIMGISKAEVKARFEELADFAELGDYLMRPVRTYSSGMTMRLGFAVAMMAHPEVLILDEVLAVGDQHFQKKCMDRIREIRQSGTTILFVSHSTYHVRQICDRAIWINEGAVVMAGDPTTVTDEYVNFQYALSAGQDAQMAQATGQTVMTQLPHLYEVKLCRPGNEEPVTEFESGEEAEIHLAWRNPGASAPLHLGAILNRNDDIQVWSTRSRDAGLVLDGEEGVAVLRVKLNLTAGEFYLSGYLLDESCDHVVDQRLAWCRFKVSYSGMEKGVYRPSLQWLVLQDGT